MGPSPPHPTPRHCRGFCFFNKKFGKYEKDNSNITIGKDNTYEKITISDVTLESITVDNSDKLEEIILNKVTIKKNFTIENCKNLNKITLKDSQVPDEIKIKKCPKPEITASPEIKKKIKYEDTVPKPQQPQAQPAPPQPKTDLAKNVTSLTKELGSLQATLATLSKQLATVQDQLKPEAAEAEKKKREAAAKKKKEEEEEEEERKKREAEAAKKVVVKGDEVIITSDQKSLLTKLNLEGLALHKTEDKLVITATEIGFTGLKETLSSSEESNFSKLFQSILQKIFAKKENITGVPQSAERSDLD